MPRRSIADYTVVLFSFLGNSISIVIALIYIPTNSVSRFLLPHPYQHSLLFFDGDLPIGGTFSVTTGSL
jgi:hypothetical protein